jgi:hypothetical protein
MYSFWTNKFFLVATWVLVFMASGCTPSLDEATEVGEKYLFSRFRGEYSALDPHISRQSRKQFEQLRQIRRQDMGASYQPPAYTILRTEGKGKEAFVYYQLEGFGEDRVHLVAEGGKWKIVLPKL